MNKEISKLLDIARQQQSITISQENYILKRAKETNEDIDEIQFHIDSIKAGMVHSQKRRKCPNCGAIISDNTLTCPECGYVFDKESGASAEVHDYIKELEQKLKEIDDEKDPDGIIYDNFIKNQDIRKASIISTFIVPNTKEHLVSLFSFSYANYIATKDNPDSIVAPAWLGRARNAYLLLKSQPVIDAKTKDLLQTYSFIENEKFKPRVSFENSPLMGICFAIIFLGAAAAIIFGIVFS